MTVDRPEYPTRGSRRNSTLLGGETMTTTVDVGVLKSGGDTAARAWETIRRCQWGGVDVLSKTVSAAVNMASEGGEYDRGSG